MPKLRNRVVAYINMDAVVTGENIDSTASIPLKKLIVKAMKNVPDPKDPSNYERTYFDFWKGLEHSELHEEVCTAVQRSIF